MNPQFNKGVIEMCVMALLLQKDRYGYEIVESISERIEISEGTVYPILRRLIVEGYAETYLQESSSGPPRKYYRLSASGRKQATQVLRDWEKFVTDVDYVVYRKSAALPSKTPKKADEK